MWGFQFGRRAEFVAERAAEILLEVPAGPGVFCLRGEDAAAQPYLMRAADMRRRVMRLLAPPETDGAGQVVLSKRLNLRERVRWVEWTRTGSEFESLLVLYEASAPAFGREEARRRLRLYAPYCVRLTTDNALPRLLCDEPAGAQKSAGDVWAVRIASRGGALLRGGAGPVSNCGGAGRIWR